MHTSVLVYSFCWLRTDFPCALLDLLYILVLCTNQDRLEFDEMIVQSEALPVELESLARHSQKRVQKVCVSAVRNRR